MSDSHFGDFAPVEPPPARDAAHFSSGELCTLQDLHFLGRWIWCARLSNAEEARADRMWRRLDEFLTREVGTKWRVQESLV